MEEKALMKDFGRRVPSAEKFQLQVKKVITSFGCYGNSDAIITLINANVHHHLIQLWRLFFQIFVKDNLFH